MDSPLDQYWQGILQSDVRALEMLYKKVFPSLVRYAVTIVLDRQSAEEIVQDVLLKLWQNRYTIIIHDSFKAFLFRWVHNHALNTLRHQKTLKQSINKPCPDGLWLFIAENYDLNDQIIDRLYAAETSDLIKEIVEELPDQCRRVFCMSRYDALTNEEIAVALNLTENTIKTHIYRALQKLYAALEISS